MARLSPRADTNQGRHQEIPSRRLPKRSKMADSDGKASSVRLPAALSRSLSKKATQTLQDLVTCSICLDNFRRPKMLPCLHTYCCQCLQSLIHGPRIQCPQCRSEVTVPREGVTGFLNNIYIQAFLEVLALEDANVDDPPRCSSCLTLCDDVACEHCNQTLCTVCRSRHAGALKEQLDTILQQLQEALTRLRKRRSDVQKKFDEAEAQIRRASEVRIQKLREDERLALHRLSEMNTREISAMDNLMSQVMTSIDNVRPVTQTSYDNLSTDSERVSTFLQIHHEASDVLTEIAKFGHLRISFDEEQFEVHLTKDGNSTNHEDNHTSQTPSSENGGATNISPHSIMAPLSQNDDRQRIEEHVRFYRAKSFTPRLRLGVGILQRPVGIALAPGTRDIYVVSVDTHRVHVFDLQGKFQRSFGTRGHGSGEFLCPFGIAFSRLEPLQILITDKYKHCVHVFDKDGNFVKQIGSKGGSPGHFRSPEGIAVDCAGNIYVCDTCNDRIQVLDKDGVYLREFGVRHDSSSRQHVFNEPTAVALTVDGRVVICDYGNHRVRVFSASGEKLLSFGNRGTLKGQFQFPEALAVDRHGFIFVGDSGNGRIQIFKSDGSYIRSFGSKGTRFGRFSWISGIVITDEYDVIVSDFKNHCVQMF